jgi:hypothetical protein
MSGGLVQQEWAHSPLKFPDQVCSVALGTTTFMRGSIRGSTWSTS